MIEYNINLLNIYFDINYYKKNNLDLFKFTNDELINHFIQYGRYEKRIFYNLREFDWLRYYIDYKLDFKDINYIHQHFLYNYYINYKFEKINKIENCISFNYIEYKNNHKDLHKLNKDQLKDHYNNYGRNEKRKIMNIPKCFNWVYYLIKYEIKDVKTVDDIFNNYVYTEHSKINRKLVNINTIVDYDNKKLSEKQSIIYNKINIIDYDNQKLKEQTINENFTSINNNKCVNFNNFPLVGIIYVFYNRKNELANESNLSFFINQTVLNDNKNIYLFIINNNTCEVNIPIQRNVYIMKNRNCYDIEAYGIGINYLQQKHNNIERFVLMNCSVTGPFYNNNNWLSKFENKIKQDKAVICSTIVYRFNNKKFVPGYFNYIINDKNVISLLKRVLIHYNSKENAIDNGEYGISKILHQNNYKITSIQDNNVNSYRGDRDNNLNRYSIYDLVFIKTNWRSLNGLDRDSIPIKYNEINNAINSTCNYNIDFFTINSELLTINHHCNHWNSKQEFYTRYGTAEKFIVYPNINFNRNKLALYFHSDKDNLFRSYCIDAVNTLCLLEYKVIICTTCNNFVNVTNLPYEKIIINNAKTDCFMFKNVMNRININNYSHLMFVNDTLLFPIHGINNMKNTINKFLNTDFWGIWSSPEQKEHIMSPFLHFTNRTFNYLKMNLSKYTFHDSHNAQQWEINLLSEMRSKGFSIGYVIDYKTLGNLNLTCPIMHPYIFPKWIIRKDVFAIKWKYMGNYLNKNKLNIPHMNYLLRYLHFNHTGPKGKPEQNGAYKNPLNYL